MKLVEETTINPGNFMREGATEVVQVLQVDTPPAATATPSVHQQPTRMPPPMVRAVRPVQPQYPMAAQGVQNRVYMEREIAFEDM